MCIANKLKLENTVLKDTINDLTNKIYNLERKLSFSEFVNNKLKKQIDVKYGIVSDNDGISDKEVLFYLKSIVSSNSAENQSEHCIEEFAELTKEFQKAKRGYDNTKDIFIEIADVYNTLDIYRKIVGLDDETLFTLQVSKLKESMRKAK